MPPTTPPTILFDLIPAEGVLVGPTGTVIVRMTNVVVYTCPSDVPITVVRTVDVATWGVGLLLSGYE